MCVPESKDTNGRNSAVSALRLFTGNFPSKALALMSAKTIPRDANDKVVE